MQRIFPLHAKDLGRAMRALSSEEKRVATAILIKLQTLNPTEEP